MNYHELHNLEVHIKPTGLDVYGLFSILIAPNALHIFNARLNWHTKSLWIIPTPTLATNYTSLLQCHSVVEF